MSVIESGLYRLGRDAELRHTANGEPVTELSLAYNYGPKDAEGKRAVQWVHGTLWGKRAEALIQHLLQGKSVWVVLEDPHNEEFTTRSGEVKQKRVGRISQLQFAGGGENREQREQRNTSAPAPSYKRDAPEQKPAAKGFDDMADDLPF
jgi:single-strand DNA-binding protein